MKINTEKIKNNVDILDLVLKDSNIKKISTSHGGEYAGPCPFCGGKDRFHVQPERGRWFCRNCHEKWGDCIEYVRKKHRTSFQEACKMLSGEEAVTSQKTVPIRQKSKKKDLRKVPSILFPDAQWQNDVKKIVAQCHKKLWENTEAKRYLYGRGITDLSIAVYKLGYNEKTQIINEHYVHEGILIPCFAGGVLWYVKIRNIATQDKSKRYRGIKGGITAAIFNAESMLGHDRIIFCEGEFDAIIAAQNIELPAITFGGATTLPDIAMWGNFFSHVNEVLAAYDNDAAGQKGVEKLRTLFGRKVKRLSLEPYSDVNEYYLSGDFNEWLRANSFPPHVPWIPECITGKDIRRFQLGVIKRVRQGMSLQRAEIATWWSYLSTCPEKIEVWRTFKIGGNS